MITGKDSLTDTNMTFITEITLLTRRAQILTQEDWNIVLFNAMERTNHWSALYFIVLMTFGNYVLFNLLVAILVEGFSTQESDHKSIESGSDASGDSRCQHCDKPIGPADIGLVQESCCDDSCPSKGASLHEESSLTTSSSRRTNGHRSHRGSSHHHHHKFLFYFKWTESMERRSEYSLFLFSPANPIRVKSLWVTEHRFFDSVILVFIALNCVTLAMERPQLNAGSMERELLVAANYIFTFVFAVEMLLKVIANGMFYGHSAYFKSGWNIMDGTLVGVSLLDLFLSFIAQRSPRIFGMLRVFRLLRSLRPLRVINRAPGLKLVVQTLLSSLRPIGNIVLICCTFFIIFGILGVQVRESVKSDIRALGCHTRFCVEKIESKKQ